MKKHSFTLNILGVIAFTLTSWNCAEDPIETDLLHYSLSIDTLTIGNLSGTPYWIAPNLGKTNNLYFGKKNDLDAFISFIEFPSYYNWEGFLDSTNTFDSLHFVVYSNDSLLMSESMPTLHFSPDSQFSEDKSSYLDYSDFSTSSTSEWTSIGLPEIKIEEDTSGNFMHAELIWDIISLFETLTDTSDSNLVRTFALKPINDDSTFFEIYSREGHQTKNPKIMTYFRRTIQLENDSTLIDTVVSPLGASADVSIINPGDSYQNSLNIGVSSGFGLRSLLSIPFDSLSLPNGALIRSAHLSIPLDSATIINDYLIIIDPLESELDTLINYFETDPYISIGYPYSILKDTENGLFELSLKSYLQNIIIGNVSNIGFKIIPSDQNDPFEKIHFNMSDTENPPVIEIIYVSN